MERLGVDLSGYSLVKWKQKSKTSLICLGITLLLSLTFSLAIFYFSLEHIAQYQEVNQSVTQLNQQITQMERELEQVKQGTIQYKTSSYLIPSATSQLLDQLNQLGIKGVIESSQIYFDGKPILKLSGRLANLTQFDTFIQPLKQQKREYKVENFQTNEKNQLEFSLLISI